MTPPPDALAGLAARALAVLEGEGEGQARAVAERRMVASAPASGAATVRAEATTRVEVLAWRDSHAVMASTTDLGESGLAGAARAADAAARALAAAAGAPGPLPPLPGAAVARSHASPDVATARPSPDTWRGPLAAARAAVGAASMDLVLTIAGGEVAIAGTSGLVAADETAFATLAVRTPGGGEARVAAASLAALDAGAVVAAATGAGADATDRAPAPPPGEHAAVLGPEAVGALLDALGPLAFDGAAHTAGHGLLAGRLGTRVAAAAINLSDSPRYTGTLPRSIDAEGVPITPVPLIQDGVAHRVVHDTASAAAAGAGARSTGHAVAPAGTGPGPRPRNLVLVGGGAADEAELAAPIGAGLLVPALGSLRVVDAGAGVVGATARGARVIAGGEIGLPLPPFEVRIDPLELLGRVEALAARPRLVLPDATERPLDVHAVVCPAVRVAGLSSVG